MTLAIVSATISLAAPPQLDAPKWPGVEGVGYAARRKAVIVGQPFAFTLLVGFASKNVVVAPVDALPPGLHFDPVTTTISGTPTQPGEYTFGFSATNADGQSTIRLNLVVEPAVPSAPPVFVGLYNRESEATEEREAPILQPDERAYYNGQLVSFALFAYGQPTQFAVSGLPRGAAMDARGVVEYRPSSLPSGRHVVTVSATNAHGTTTASFTWIVHPRLNVLNVERTQYQVGGTIRFTAEFNAPVVVVGTPFVPVRNGTRQARYVGGSGTNTLAFAYVTETADGAFREYSPQALQLGDGGIFSLDGVTATLRALWLGKVNPPEYVVNAPAPPPSHGANHTVSFVGPVSRIAVGEPVLLQAVSSAGLPIAYAVVTGEATIEGATLIPRSIAPLVVRASARGNETYPAAFSDVSLGTPERGTQTVLIPPSGGRVGETIALPAVSSAGLPVSYALLSGKGRLQGSALVCDEPGVITLAASQGGNDTYLPAKTDVFTLTIMADGPLSRLSNLSARVRVSADDRSGSSIVGFVVSGGAARQVLVRAVGPSLSAHGVMQPLGRPTLRLRSEGGQEIGTNAGWDDDALISGTGQRLGAFPLSGGSQDAAMLVTLPPGGYSAQVTGSMDGIALLEIYDAAASDAGTAGRLLNLSARGRVGAGEEVLVAGFVIQGLAEKRVLIRACGPALSAFGVADALQDPRLNVYRSEVGLVAQNDDWTAPQALVGHAVPGSREEVAAAIRAAGAFAFSEASRDAAVVMTLSPGAYSAVASGGGGQTGNALVEVYELP